MFLDGIRTIAPRRKLPPVRVGIWVKVTVSFRIGGQPDNCPRGTLLSGQGCTCSDIKTNWIVISNTCNGKIFIKHHLLFVFISIYLTSITLYKGPRFFKKLNIFKSFASSFLPSSHDDLTCFLSTSWIQHIPFSITSFINVLNKRDQFRKKVCVYGQNVVDWVRINLCKVPLSFVTGFILSQFC